MSEQQRPQDGQESTGGSHDPFGSGGGNAVGVTIISGFRTMTLPIAGSTVASARKSLSKRLNIGQEAVAVVNGTEVDENTVLLEGQTVNFISRAGEKGSDPAAVDADPQEVVEEDPFSELAEPVQGSAQQLGHQPPPVTEDDLQRALAMLDELAATPRRNVPLDGGNAGEIPQEVDELTANFIQEFLFNREIPHEARARSFAENFGGERFDDVYAVMSEILRRYENTVRSGAIDPESLRALRADYESALRDLMTGPIRQTNYLGDCDGEEGVSFIPAIPAGGRIRVLTADGGEAYPVMPAGPTPALEQGQVVITDNAYQAVLGFGNVWSVRAGETATFIRYCPVSDLIECADTQGKKAMYRISGKLRHRIQELAPTNEQPATVAVPTEQANAAEPTQETAVPTEQAGPPGIATWTPLKRGALLSVDSKRMFAWSEIPKEDDLTHRFVDDSKLPRVDIDREVANPHWCLDWLNRRTRVLTFRPDLIEEFKMRPRASLLMAGPPGTGKSHHIKAFLSLFREILAERAGHENTGSRVIRVKTSELFSMWFGESDRLIDQFFNDVQEIARTKVKDANGDEIALPLVLILEEADGISGRRSQEDTGSGAYDRVMTMLLQRLDDPTDDLGRLPIIMISTTNRPDRFDAGMLRRLGGKIAHFGRMEKIEELRSVLSVKVLQGIPTVQVDPSGETQPISRDEFLEQACGIIWNNESPLLHLQLSTGGEPLEVLQRHFLTPAMVELAVSQCVDNAVFHAEEHPEQQHHGISPSEVAQFLSQHIANLLPGVTRSNLGDYIDLPANVTVSGVRVAE